MMTLLDVISNKQVFHCKSIIGTELEMRENTVVYLILEYEMR